VFQRNLLLSFCLLAFLIPSAYGMDAAFELLATKQVEGLSEMSIKDKTAALDRIIDLYVEVLNSVGLADVAAGTDGMVNLHFPPIDTNFDGTPDEVGRQVELYFSNDYSLLKLAGLDHALALPWQICVYTQGDSINVVCGVPGAILRTYFGDISPPGMLTSLAPVLRRRLESLTFFALSKEGFTEVQEGIVGSEINDETLAELEEQFGPLTAEVVAPTLTLSGVTVDEVIDAVVAAFGQDRVPDLDGDGDVDADDHKLLPNMFGQYMHGAVSFEQMAQMMGQGSNLWGQGATFQTWKSVRVLDMSRPGLGTVKVVELCQPFYAAVALSSGLHHMPAMPCAVSVWRGQDGLVHINVLDPAFIFGVFFRDAAKMMADLAPTNPMMARMGALFAVFPTFVFNEIVAVTNAALGELGTEQSFTYHQFPTQQ